VYCIKGLIFKPLVPAVVSVSVNCISYQEQAGEWEQERLELNNEISKLTEHNERLTSELNTRSLTVDKLKNKVCEFFRRSVVNNCG